MKLELIKKVGKHRGYKMRKGIYGLFDEKGLLLIEYKTEKALVSSLGALKPKKDTLPKGVVKGK